MARAWGCRAGSEATYNFILTGIDSFIVLFLRYIISKSTF